MKKNTIAQTLVVISWVIYIAGLIVGFVFMSNAGYSWYEPEDLLAALPWWIGSFIGGTLLLGFAEIINLLQQLVNKRSEVKVPEKSEETKAEETFTDLPTL